MELYLMPSSDGGNAAVTREAVLGVLTAAGVPTASEASETKPEGVTFWRLRLAGADVSVDFQEREGVLTFATVDVSIFDSSSIADRVCAALEAAGWEIDQENVG